MSENTIGWLTGFAFVGAIGWFIYNYGKNHPMPAETPKAEVGAKPAPWGGPDYLTYNRPVPYWTMPANDLPQLGNYPGAEQTA